jgi:hypothetical protein
MELFSILRSLHQRVFLLSVLQVLINPAYFVFWTLWPQKHVRFAGAKLTEKTFE